MAFTLKQSGLSSTEYRMSNNERCLELHRIWNFLVRHSKLIWVLQSGSVCDGAVIHGCFQGLQNNPG